MGAAAGRLVDEQDRPQIGFNVRAFPTAATLAFETLGWNRIWASNPVNRRYRVRGFDADKEQDVEQPAGAFLMVRRDVFKAVGGWTNSSIRFGSRMSICVAGCIGPGTESATCRAVRHDTKGRIRQRRSGLNCDSGLVW